MLLPKEQKAYLPPIQVKHKTETSPSPVQMQELAPEIHKVKTSVPVTLSPL
jgi:hypothetical protein